MVIYRIARGRKMEGEQGCRNRIGKDNKEDNCRERIEDEETKPNPWK